MSEQETQQIEANGPVFDFSLYGNSELKQILGAINEIVEEATLSIDNEGLTFRAMDPSHVCMIDLALPNSCFEKFNVTNPGNFCVRIEELFKVVKALNKKDTIRISLHENILTIATRYNKTELRTLEASSTDTPIPKLTYNAKVGINFKELKRSLKQIEVVSEHVTMQASNMKYILSGKGDNGSNEIVFEKGMPEMPELEIKEDTKSTYSLEYLLAFFKHLDPGTVILEYSEKMPLRIEVRMFNTSYFRMHFYLAPRVEN